MPAPTAAPVTAIPAPVAAIPAPARRPATVPEPPIVPAPAVPARAAAADAGGFEVPTFVEAAPGEAVGLAAGIDSSQAKPLAPPPSTVATPESVPLPLKSPPTGSISAHVPERSDLSAPRTFVEPTPAPLPPSPDQARDADVWFEEAPTRPSVLGDLAPSGMPLRGRPTSRTSMPSTPSGIRAASLDPGDPTGVDGGLPDVPTGSDELTDTSVPPARPAWMMPALVASAALAIGIVLGALLFGGRGGHGGKPAPERLATVAPPCPTPATAALIPPRPDSVPDAGAAEIATPTPAPTPAPTAAADAGTAVVEGPADTPVQVPANAPLIPVGKDIGRGDCRARLESLPPGARLRIAGRELGVAPIEVSGLPCDTPITVEAVRTNFEPYKRQVTFTAQKDRFLVSLRRPQVGLQVTSLPLGAVVSVGGKPVGKTPLKLQVNAHSKTAVRVSLAGYKDFDTTIAPKPGSPASIAAKLERLPKGGVKPAVTPPPAKPGAAIPGKPGAIPAKPGAAIPARPGAAIPAKPGAAIPAKPGAAKPAAPPPTAAKKPR